MAYVIKPKASKDPLPYLPEESKLKSGSKVIFDHYQESDVPEMFEIFKSIIEEGQTYPQDSISDIKDFRSYYLSHDAFVLREKDSTKVLGAFYVKPNFPGRSSHICNAGFIVGNDTRGQGVGTFLVPKFLQVAKDLGYQASFFNLVYVSNTASIKLWDSFGFQQVGRIPNAGNLKGLGYVDALQYYFDFYENKKL